MRGFVIDTSVVMAWCFKDEADQYADAVLDLLAASTAFAPSIWPLEVCNVLIVAERKKRLGEADSTRFLELITGLPITIESEPFERIMREILSLARKHRLSTYDASYLELAMRKGLPIATLDSHLRTAAKRSRVPMLEMPPEER